MMYDREKSDSGHNSCEAGEQSRATGCGVGGAKGGAEGNAESAKHGPDAVPGNRVTSAGAHAARCDDIAKCRYIPEAGAVCPNWARTDLCGGREVTRVPTANHGQTEKSGRVTGKSAFPSIVLQNGFWGGERKFLEPLRRFTRGDVRDHIVSSKIDHQPLWRR